MNKKVGLILIAFMILFNSSALASITFSNFSNNEKVKITEVSSDLGKVSIKNGLAYSSGTSSFVSMNVEPKERILVNNLGLTIKYKFKIESSDNGSCSYVQMRPADSRNDAFTSIKISSNPEIDKWYEGEFRLHETTPASGRRQFKSGDYLAKLRIDARNGSSSEISLVVEYVSFIEDENYIDKETKEEDKEENPNKESTQTPIVQNGISDPYIKIDFDNDAQVSPVYTNNNEQVGIKDGCATITGNSAFQSMFVTPAKKIPLTSMGTRFKYRFKVMAEEEGASAYYFAIRIYDETETAGQSITVKGSPINNDQWYEGEFPIYKGSPETGKRAFKSGDIISKFRIDGRNTIGKKITVYLDYLETVAGDQPSWVIPSAGLEEIERVNKEVNSATPGSTIIIKDGTYSNVKLDFKSKGTKEKPITVRAQTPGKVIINGNSSLYVSGEHIVVDGLFFKDGFAQPRVIYLTPESKNCRLTNIAIINVNDDGRKDTDIRWIQAQGSGHEVDHCYFKNKTTVGLILDGVGQDFYFHNNYFGYFEEAVSNGGEAIRVRSEDDNSFGAKYRKPVNSVVEYNFFDRCEGEAELVSVKGVKNIFRYNNIYYCKGALTLRYTIDNLIESNIFVGGKQHRYPTTLRIMGDKAVVKNNYFFNSGVDNPALYMDATNTVEEVDAGNNWIDYNPLIDAQISNNSFINCNSSIWFDYYYNHAKNRYGYGTGTLSNNLFFSEVGESTMFKEARNTNGFEFKDNIAFGKPLGLNVVPDGLKIEQPKLTKYSDILYFSEDEKYGVNKEEILKVPQCSADVFDNNNWIKEQILNDEKKEFSLTNFKFVPLSDAEIHKDKTIPELASNAVWWVSADVVVLKLDANRAYKKTQLYYIDENNHNVTPFLSNDRTFVPLRFISENLDAEVSWIESEQKIKIKTKTNKNVELVLGSKEMLVDGQVVQLDVPAFTENARTFVPLRAVSEALGCIVHWDDRGVIIIGYDKSHVDSIVRNDPHIVKVIKQLS